MRRKIRDADRFYGEPLERFDAMSNSESSEPVDAAHFKMWCKIAADEIRHARELQSDAERDRRHWQEEVGKLHAQIGAIRDSTRGVKP